VAFVLVAALACNQPRSDPEAAEPAVLGPAAIADGAAAEAGAASPGDAAGASCVPAWKQACGRCGGMVACDGSCAEQAPAGIGLPCGPCGATVGCDGQCERKAPLSFGQSCDGCGGTVGCDGSCLRRAPANHGASCDPCGGRIDCYGNCTGGQGGGANVGMVCSSCGDRLGCKGHCEGPSARVVERTVTLTAAQREDPVRGRLVECPAGFEEHSCVVVCHDGKGRRCQRCGAGAPVDPRFCSCYAWAEEFPVTCTVTASLLRVGCTSRLP
jgi:hypothetical protein